MMDSAREIENLLYTYAERIDAGDLDGVAALFEHGRICGVEDGPPETVFAGIKGVRQMYASSYPQIITAVVSGPELVDGKQVFTFKTAVGTKG